MSELALKKAIIAKLKADNTVAGDRNYDRAPSTPPPTFPYTTLGPFDSLTEEADEYDGKDISFQVDVWARGTGNLAASVEVMQIGEAVRNALHEEELTLDGARLVALTIDRVNYTRDPDGITEHGIVTGRARTEPTA